MRINKADGTIRLSKADTKKWNTSGTFRQDVTELMSDLVHEHLSKRGHGSVLVYDAEGVYVASIWTKEKSPKSRKS